MGFLPALGTEVLLAEGLRDGSFGYSLVYAGCANFMVLLLKLTGLFLGLSSLRLAPGAGDLRPFGFLKALFLDFRTFKSLRMLSMLAETFVLDWAGAPYPLPGLGFAPLLCCGLFIF